MPRTGFSRFLNGSRGDGDDSSGQDEAEFVKHFPQIDAHGETRGERPC